MLFLLNNLKYFLKSKRLELRITMLLLILLFLITSAIILITQEYTYSSNLTEAEINIIKFQTI